MATAKKAKKTPGEPNPVEVLADLIDQCELWKVLDALIQVCGCDAHPAVNEMASKVEIIRRIAAPLDDPRTPENVQIEACYYLATELSGTVVRLITGEPIYYVGEEIRKRARELEKPNLNDSERASIISGVMYFVRPVIGWA